MAQRLPPQNVDAEKSILGAILLDRDALVKVLSFLKPEHFYEKRHGIIYKAMSDLFMASVSIDQLTLTDFLQKQNVIQEVGGRSYLVELIESVPTSAHAEQYAKTIKEKALRRSLISAAATITDLAFDEEKPTNDVVNQSQHELFTVSVQGVDKGFTRIADVLEQVYEEAAQVNVADGSLLGVPTGFRDVDGMLGGLQKSDLIILAARPSMGKSSFMLDMTRNIALAGNKVAIFSLEMSQSQLASRLLSSQSGVGLWDMRTGKLTEEEFARLSEGTGILSDLHISIDDTPGANIVEVRTKARRLYMEQGLDAIFIDYLQLIQGNTREGRVQEVSQISQELKNMARELRVPVIALSQLSRKTEDRPDKLPQLSDLRDSGSIEQDADVVMFIHREDYYDPETEKKGIAEIKVAKHRNGPTGSIELAWVKEMASFRNLSKEQE
ncbi:MAG: replicative DNA helicase [Candidatus Dojkabacteria bacterium]|nr:MAG: replicative DNA helicase [Candidatus Dojkabacteria bacterium]